MDRITPACQILRVCIRAVLPDQGIKISVRFIFGTDRLYGGADQGFRPFLPFLDQILIRRLRLGKRLFISFPGGGHIFPALGGNSGKGDVLQSGGDLVSRRVIPCTLALEAFGHLVGIIQQNLLDGPVPCRRPEGLIPPGKDFFLIQIQVVFVPFPVGIQKLVFIIFPHHVIRDNQLGTEQLDGPVAPLRRLVFFVKGLRRVAGFLHEFGHLIFGEFFFTLLRFLPDSLPVLLIAVAGSFLQAVLFFRGKIILSGILQLALNQARGHKALDRCVPLFGFLFLRQVYASDQLGKIKIRLQCRLNLTLCIGDASHTNHRRIIRFFSEG